MYLTYYKYFVSLGPGLGMLSSVFYFRRLASAKVDGMHLTCDGCMTISTADWLSAKNARHHLGFT